MKTHRFLALAAGLLALLVLPSTAQAGIEPSSTVLVPYFEVDLSEFCRTTFFAVSNHSPIPHVVEVQMRTNWGIPVLTFSHTIPANGVFTANLADWLVRGNLPDGRVLSTEQIAHLQAALSGKPSPDDGLYYGTEIYAGDWAVGSVRFRVFGTSPPDVLWGDYFIYCTKAPLVQGETLVNLDRSVDEHLPCKSHGIRFLDKEAIRTELMFWSGLRGGPYVEAPLPDFNRLEITMEIYDETGDLMETRLLRLLPNQLLPLEEIDLPAHFGWVQLTSEDDFFVTGHVSQLGAIPVSLSLHSYCLPEEAPPGANEGISIEKRVNGEDADVPPGPTLPIGSLVSWTYEVTNVGDDTLTNVTVTDDQGVTVTCPKTTLAPGESMLCTASGTAVAGQYANVGTATGTPPSGPEVTATDPAHYFGGTAAINLEKLVNGEDADTPPGPTVPVGSELLWSFVVTNTGAVALAAVTVTDSEGLVITCPKTKLDAGESMTCTAKSTAEAGLHSNVGTASGTPEGGAVVGDTDPCNYTGELPGPQGCSPGYWKNHTGSWPPTGYSPSQKVNTVFAVPGYYSTLGGATLLEALSFAGGTGGEGAAAILLREAVGALLNASHPDVDYPLTPAEVIALVDAALPTTRDAMLSLASQLDEYNNLYCTLD